MTDVETLEDDLIPSVRQWVPKLRLRSDEIERARRLPQDLAASFAQAGYYAALVPRAYGGLEIDPLRYSELIRTLAEGDASAAWCVMIGSTTGLSAAYMPESAARGIFTPIETAVTAGVFAPRGRAIPERDGYRVTGRWQWGSGSPNAQWIAGGCAIIRDGKPELMPNKLPLSRMMFVPAADAELLDTWNVSGLCGTGSTDFAIQAKFVPAERAVSPVADKPLETPLYLFPIFALLGIGVSSVCLGIARAAIDELISFASAKTPEASFKPLAKRQDTQMTIARAEAQLRSARAWLEQTIEVAWETACRLGDIPMELRRDVHLANYHAAQSSAAAVDMAYNLGGGTSVYRTSPLQRHFRDVHVATQHMLVGPSRLEMAGQHLLGLESERLMF